jgi:hypothetical protein
VRIGESVPGLGMSLHLRRLFVAEPRESWFRFVFCPLLLILRNFPFSISPIRIMQETARLPVNAKVPSLTTGEILDLKNWGQKQKLSSVQKCPIDRNFRRFNGFPRPGTNPTNPPSLPNRNAERTLTDLLTASCAGVERLLAGQARLPLPDTAWRSPIFPGSRSRQIQYRSFFYALSADRVLTCWGRARCALPTS